MRAVVLWLGMGRSEAMITIVVLLILLSMKSALPMRLGITIIVVRVVELGKRACKATLTVGWRAFLYALPGITIIIVLIVCCPIGILGGALAATVHMRACLGKPRMGVAITLAAVIYPIGTPGGGRMHSLTIATSVHGARVNSFLVMGGEARGLGVAGEARPMASIETPGPGEPSAMF